MAMQQRVTRLTLLWQKEQTTGRVMNVHSEMT